MFAPPKNLAALRKRSMSLGIKGGGLFSDAKTRVQTLWGKVPTPLKAAIPIIGGLALTLLGAKMAPTMPVAATLASLLGTAAFSAPIRNIDAEPWTMVPAPQKPAPQPSRFKIIRKGQGGYYGGGILAARPHGPTYCAY